MQGSSEKIMQIFSIASIKPEFQLEIKPAFEIINQTNRPPENTISKWRNKNPPNLSWISVNAELTLSVCLIVGIVYNISFCQTAGSYQLHKTWAHAFIKSR